MTFIPDQTRHELHEAWNALYAWMWDRCVASYKKAPDDVEWREWLREPKTGRTITIPPESK